MTGILCSVRISQIFHMYIYLGCIHTLYIIYICIYICITYNIHTFIDIYTYERSVRSLPNTVLLFKFISGQKINVRHFILTFLRTNKHTNMMCAFIIPIYSSCNSSLYIGRSYHMMMMMFS
jgi:hypothetical protein